MRLQAIDFVQMQQDDELWDLLISLALADASLTGDTAHNPPPCNLVLLHMASNPTTNTKPSSGLGLRSLMRTPAWSFQGL